MTPHPDFVDVALPVQATFPGFSLTPLTPEFVDEDYAAVMATAPLLGEIFGDWPSGLTHADNVIDLAWHAREFTTRRSFSWILRNDAGGYIGCFYVFPDIGRRGHATAVLWLCDIPNRPSTAKSMAAALHTWLAGLLPASITLRWETSPRLDTAPHDQSR